MVPLPDRLFEALARIPRQRVPFWGAPVYPIKNAVPAFADCPPVRSVRLIVMTGESMNLLFGWVDICLAHAFVSAWNCRLKRF